MSNPFAQLNQLIAGNNAPAQITDYAAQLQKMLAPVQTQKLGQIDFMQNLKNAANGINQPINNMFQSNVSPEQGNWFTNNVMDMNDETGKMDMKWGGQALQGLSDIAQFGMNWSQFNLAKDSIKQQNALNKANFNNAVQTTNTSMEGRARARYESNPEKYAKPADYMAKNKLKGYGG